MIHKTENAVLLITFIKFDTAFSVLEKIKEAHPPRLYIASDGGRTREEHQKILSFRKKLLDSIDWDCQVFTFFQNNNNGCKYGPYNAITWFFSHEQQGIILEDDCLPHNSFFKFCDDLLEKYKTEEKVFMISGWSAFEFSKETNKHFIEDYYFSKYPHIWGWATWRRAWQDYKIDQVDRIMMEELSNIDYDCVDEKKYWNKVFEIYRKKNIDAWDYPMLFYIFSNHLLCILPKTNMIKNIGFNRKDATHTNHTSKFQKLNITKQSFPLQHPRHIVQNKEIDMINFQIVFKPECFFLRLLHKIKNILWNK